MKKDGDGGEKVSVLTWFKKKVNGGTSHQLTLTPKEMIFSIHSMLKSAVKAVFM